GLARLRLGRPARLARVAPAAADAGLAAARGHGRAMAGPAAVRARAGPAPGLVAGHAGRGHTPRTAAPWPHTPMFKPVPVAIGLPYLRAKRRNGFISFISMASILGIAIGVAALITTLAVMTGFQREIRDRMLQMAAHATVTADGEAMETGQQAIAVARSDARLAR